ncbi:methionyl-tRNA formyltransferase [Methylobacterium persicinum]|uniref:Methionyl-tRNA formyltransferase n=1 Tax=Methylobacterium persicinum TaxID=374426 RepID=A0ABU0HKK4_9HYPH|nr:formyltransferase family protein [Methylobacterium persicinum]MDQ0442240.1 methionyl-tRNA formyltransferase [Methylobacterium persicinum]
MRIALIIQDDFGEAILDAFPAGDTPPVGMLCLGTDTHASSEAARKRGVPVHSLADLAAPEAEVALRGFDADLAVMSFIDAEAPRHLFDIPRKGTIQAHLSLLPRYRGPSPVQWPIARGEIGTGVTVIRPGDAPYEGPVILQRTCAIGPDDTAGELKRTVLIPLAAEALAAAAAMVLRGEHLEIEQDEDAATYEGAFGDAEAEIRWTEHGGAIHELIRAANPDPGAWTRLDGQRLRILDACFHPVHRRADVRGVPGEVVAVDDDAFSVSAPGGEIEVRRVIPEGGAPVDAAGYAQSVGLTAGQRLGV